MSFLHEHWAKNHILSRDAALFRWQYEAKLRDGREDAPTVLLAWRCNKIVGMLGLTFMRWLQEGLTYTGAWSSHWFVVPELRTSPLSLLLIREASRLGIEVLGTVGTTSHSSSILRARGYDWIPEIPRWVGIIDQTSTATLLLASGIPASQRDEVTSFCQERVVRHTHAASHAEDWQIVEWSDKLGDEWDVCWNRSAARGFVGVIRNAAYLRWRYARHPRFKYEIRLARHCSSGVGGLLVFRLETVRGRTEQVARICELLTEGPDATNSLLSRFVGDARQAGISFADFYCSKPIQGLSEAGFNIERTLTDPFTLPSRLQPVEQGGRPLNSAIRFPASLRGSLEDAVARGALYLTKSDGDQDRPN
ncbi:MAG TPA: hypothetical protein VGH98_25535 [Gemmatimonadaceae bacterium]